MKPSLTVSEEIVSWAEMAGYGIKQGTETDDGRVMFTAGLGEIRKFVDREVDGWITVKDSDRLGPEYTVFAAFHTEVIERYFLDVCGRTIRSERKLPRLRIPMTSDRIAEGFVLAPKGFRGEERLALQASDGGGVIAFSRRDPIIATFDLVRLSYLLRASTEDIKASFLNTSGSPLFHS